MKFEWHRNKYRIYPFSKQNVPAVTRKVSKKFKANEYSLWTHEKPVKYSKKKIPC